MRHQAFDRSQELISALEALNLWVPSEVFSNKPNYRTNWQTHLTQLVENGHSNLKSLDDELFLTFASAIADYRVSNRHLIIQKDEGYAVLRYDADQEYKEHVDNSGCSSRVLSGLLYLNDEYTGGELSFPRQGLTIQPKSGQIVLFPSGFAYPHFAHPVKTGRRYVVATWFS